ncbi:hypothetical protein BH23PLA1_BH23PLA1_35940 [soil metagenome]
MDLKRFQAPTASHFAWVAHGLFLLTLYGSLVPFRYRSMPLEEALQRFRQITYYDPTLAWARGDWVVNMVQYALLSFFYMAALCVDRRWYVGLLAAFVVIPGGGLTALIFEFLQIYFPRTVSINDLIVEGAGVLLGVVAWLFVGQGFTNWLRRFWGAKGIAGLARQALPAYFGMLLITHLMPFDFVLSADEIVAQYHKGRVQLIPFGDLLAAEGSKPWLNLLVNLAVFLPLGALLGLLPSRSKRPWQKVALLGLGVTVLIEFFQLLVYTRYFDVTDILTGTAAILFGWWGVRALRGSKVLSRFESLVSGPSRRFGATSWVALALAWTALLLVVNWQPFEFTTDPTRFRGVDPDLTDENTPIFGLRRMAWAPFVDYYWGSRYNALDQFVRRTLSFAPLGALLALAFGRFERLGLLVTVLAALLLSAVIETGQYFIPERHPSTTDALIQTLGAWVGFRMARHVAQALGPDLEARGEAHYRYRYQDQDRARFDTDRPKVVRPFEGGSSSRSWSGSNWGPAAMIGTRSRPRLARVARRLSTRLDRLAAWLDTWPYEAQLVSFGAVAIVASVGVVLVVNLLGRF